MDWYDKFTSLPMRTVSVILYTYFIGISILSVAVSCYIFK